MLRSVKADVAADAGGVDDDVDRPEPALHRVGHPGDRIGIGDVARHGDGGPAVGLEPGGDGRHLVAGDVGDRDLGAMAREELDDGTADAAAAAGDERCPPVEGEVLHACPFLQHAGSAHAVTGSPASIHAA